MNYPTHTGFFNLLEHHLAVHDLIGIVWEYFDFRLILFSCLVDKSPDGKTWQYIGMEDDEQLTFQRIHVDWIRSSELNHFHCWMLSSPRETKSLNRFWLETQINQRVWIITKAIFPTQSELW
jgi:hypothetical protein